VEVVQGDAVLLQRLQRSVAVVDDLLVRQRTRTEARSFSRDNELVLGFRNVPNVLFAFAAVVDSCRVELADVVFLEHGEEWAQLLGACHRSRAGGDRRAHKAHDDLDHLSGC